MPNVLDDLKPKILAMALDRLRKRLVMPQLVNRDYNPSPADRGETVNVPVPPSIATREVSPGVTPDAAPGVTANTVPITLDQWHEAPIAFTDKDRVETIDASVEMSVDAAVDALAEKVNGSVMALASQVPNLVGTPGTTPFGSDYALSTAARKILNRNKAPLPNRRLVIDPDAEENAINLSEFADSSFTARDSVIIEGDIGRKLGFDWVMDQQVPSHETAGTGDGDITVNGNQSAGAEEVSLAKGAGDNWEAVEGDVIQFAGHDQTYLITEDVTVTQGGNTTVSISPELQEDVADAEEVTVFGSHVANLAFHRDAFALAVRPFRQPASNAEVLTMIDDATGLPLRLEVSRQNKQDYWSFDLLWGVRAIRPDLAVRVAG
jgi:hypothetical protein